MKQDFQRAVLDAHPRDGTATRAALARGAVPLRRISRVRDRRARTIRPATRSSSACRGRRKCIADRRHAEHQLAPLGAAGRVLAHAAADVPHEDLPGAQSTTSARSIASDLCGKDERLSPGYTITESGQDARVSVLTGRPPRTAPPISAVEELRRPAGLCVRGQGLRRAAERAGDRPRLRRPQSTAARRTAI